jgi:multiple sugar transport system substrate-binding protein
MFSERTMMFGRKKNGVAAGIAAFSASAALILTGCAGGGEETPEAYDPDEKVTLSLAFWGSDERAALYTEAISAFNEEYPNITVNLSYLGFPEFWEKRQTEAAGGGLPDVMQFDYTYLRQYSDNGLLLDLEPYLGEIISTDGLSESVLGIGVVNDTTTALPIGTNAWALFTNPKLLAEVGVEEFAGGDWDDYNEWVAEVTDAAEAKGIPVWGGQDPTGRIQNFEIQRRAAGEDLFTEDGEPNFSEEDLAAFWEQSADAREAGAFVSEQKKDEVFPLGPFESAFTLSELSWDNFGTAYLGNLGADYTEVGLLEPPVTEEGAEDLFLKPSMLHAISAKSDHPEAAATLVDFLINAPESGEIFGTSRGLPASETQLEGVEKDALTQQIVDHEAAIADRIGDAPPVPVVGYGSLEEKFRVLGTELGFGTVTVDEAVDEFFAEMDVILNQ